MLVRFWGVRGSIASAITADVVEQKIRKVLELATPADILTPDTIDHFVNKLELSLKGTYGGNTTCIEIRTKNDELIIVDGGTGLRPLGASLMAEERFRGSANISLFYTHTHWDHIQGLMFFAPVYFPGNKINIYSSVEDIEQRLRYQQVRTHFPITLDEKPSQYEFITFKEGEEVETHGVKVSSKSVRHPGGCYSYKFDEDGKKFVFASDAEFSLDIFDEIGHYIEYFKDADVLVFDTQYTFEESLQRIDWGHSSAQIATDIAIKSNIKTLVLFHHDPSYSDEKMVAVHMQALKYKDMIAPQSRLEIIAAYEGLELQL